MICYVVNNTIKFSKFDFARSDYVWCLKNQNVNVVRSKV